MKPWLAPSVYQKCAHCGLLFRVHEGHACNNKVVSDQPVAIEIGADPAPTPLAGQVGGSHYKQMKIQPAVYTTANGIGHMAGDAIAYISRYKFKNGRQDLEKAIHSIQLLIELEYGEASGDDPRAER